MVGRERGQGHEDVRAELWWWHEEEGNGPEGTENPIEVLGSNRKIDGAIMEWE